ncbi:mitochondrial ribosomal protein L28 [Dermatophagoides pteronyssinus]|uniref:Large ribosomal subunit protein bL28m n=1 Tax=Dermatophagoides pteronyssinus TaxID=6956 RepID=A0A6P6YG80_DERPT|nr:39S ribosomal protein L28, mitochondrial-like [Dermatophagoides pteronyssinus]
MVRYGRIPSWSFPHITSRLPEHYYRHRQELTKPSERVHDRPVPTDFLDFKYSSELSKPIRVPDVPISVTYPKEADAGLWGGEGIVKGYVKPRKYFQAGWPRPKYWFPNLKKVVMYSEILDTHFQIICTRRTLSLIDDYYGFDNYILRSKVHDLKSQLGLALRRQMLLKLAKKEFKDENHEQQMLDKYGDCIIPLEEAEWFGLTVQQAVTRHKKLTAKDNQPIPLKYELARKLLYDLEHPTPETSDQKVHTKDSSGWFDKIKSTLGLNKSSSP